jgi:hypothetical protein
VAVPFIPLEVFANNPSTTVSSGGTTAPAGGTVETWTVASSASFPVVEIGAQQFHVADPALPGEIITVQNISGATWTVVRGAESSPVAAHAASFTVVQVVSAGDLAGLQYPPWQFPVEAYAAQGDGKIGAGGTGASGQAVFTDAGAAFINAAAPAGDVGKVIIINQGTGSATVGTNPFCGTIISVNSATSVTLNANLAATCASAPYIYGTDDASAINAAVLAASQWAAATGNFKVQVIFEPALYMLGALIQSTTYQWSPFNTGLNYVYNTHIPLPFTTQYARKLVIDLVGLGGAAVPDFWGSVIPNVQGSCLVSTVFPPSQPDATFGQMSVIGTPSKQTSIGTGGIAGFANVLVNVEGITVVTPFNSQIYSYDFRYAAQVHVDNSAAIAFAPVNFAAQTCGGPWLRNTNLPANAVGTGLAMPWSGNNDLSDVNQFGAEGLYIGVMFSEHFIAQRVTCMYCNIGCVAENTLGSNTHGAAILDYSCEASNYGISSAGASGQFPLFIGLMDTEVINTADIFDSLNMFTGTVHWNDYERTTMNVTGASGLNIVNTRLPPGPWAGAPAAPASGTASTNTQQNTAYRPAVIYASAGTSVTATFTGPAATGLTALGQTSGGGTAAVPIRVPSGHYYAVTYTGTLTTKWVLE